ncbi:MAG: hypothetical protein K0B15_07110 [Lentimicrobium sp.]|nr:hypothetical protein [Lentimicrobium sp.]
METHASDSLAANLQLLSKCFHQINTDAEHVVICSELINLADKVSVSHPWFTMKQLLFAFISLGDALDKIEPKYLPFFEIRNQIIVFWCRPLSPPEGIDLLIIAILAGFRCVIKSEEYNKEFYEGIIYFIESKIPYLSGRAMFGSRPEVNAIAYVIVGERPTENQLKYFTRKPVFNEVMPEISRVALITGKETPDQIDLLANDLCIYFGRSLYNVRELLVPEGYDFKGLLKSLEKYQEHAMHSRYFNHYEYFKSSLLVSGKTFIDNGFLLFCKENGSSPATGVIHYNEYNISDEREKLLAGRQVLLAEPDALKGEKSFGNISLEPFSRSSEFSEFLRKADQF